MAGKYLSAPPPAEGRKSGPAISATPLREAPDAGSSKSAASASANANSAPEQFATLSLRIAKMTPQEYGQRFADLLAGTNSADALLERAAMLAAVDGERGVAAYVAFKKQTGTPPGRYSAEVEQLFTVGGQRAGASVLSHK